MLYSTKQAAEKIGITYSVLQGQLFRGVLPEPAIRIGSHRLFNDNELEAVRRYFAEKPRRTVRKSDK